MNIKEFKQHIESFPIRIIEEHVVILKGEDTEPFETVLRSQGCRKSDWQDFLKGKYKLGTYLVMDKEHEDVNILDAFPYVTCFVCDLDENYIKEMNLIKERWEQKTGEAMIPFKDWSKSIKMKFLNDYQQDEVVADQFVNDLISGKIK